MDQPSNSGGANMFNLVVGNGGDSASYPASVDKIASHYSTNPVKTRDSVSSSSKHHQRTAASHFAT